MFLFLVLVVAGIALLSLDIYFSYLVGNNIGLFVSVFSLIAILFLTFKPRSTFSRFIKKDLSVKPKPGQCNREYWIFITSIWVILAISGILLTTSIHSCCNNQPPAFLGVFAYFISPIFSIACFFKAIASIINAVKKKEWVPDKDLKYGQLMRHEAYLEIDFDEIDSVLMNLQIGLDDSTFSKKISDFNESISKYELNETSFKVTLDGNKRELDYSIYIDDLEKAFIYFHSYSEDIINNINSELFLLQEENLML